MTKAEEKHQESIKTQIGHLIGAELLDFQNDYLQSFVNYKERQIETRIKKIEAMDSDLKYVDGYKRDDLITSLRRKLTRTAINNLMWLTEADNAYQIRLKKLVSKVSNANFSNMGIRVLRVDNNVNTEFQFLVRHEKDNKEVHARVIWVNSIEKTPHWRFITTVRAIK